jgi:hypothetical protein
MHGLGKLDDEKMAGADDVATPHDPRKPPPGMKRGSYYNWVPDPDSPDYQPKGITAEQFGDYVMWRLHGGS